MKMQYDDRKVMSLFGTAPFLLPVAVFLCVVFSYMSCSLALQTGNTQLLTKRALEGGHCDGTRVVFDPNGQNIIFASPKESPLTTTGVCDIYTMNIDGTGRKRLTFGTDYDGQPTVSPDGKTIAFISERDGPSHVYLMNTDGTGLRRLTQGRFNDSHPLFASDGSKVFFTRRLSDNPDAWNLDEMFSIDIDGLNEQRLTDNKYVDVPVAVSSKADTLYCLSGSTQMNLYKFDLKEQTSQEVFDNCSGCDVSPDEQWIAYISDMAKPYEYEVYVCRIDGSDRQKLTDFHGYITEVQFAPDGKHVVFVLEPKGAPRRGKGDIYIASIDGKTLQKIGSN